MENEKWTPQSPPERMGVLSQQLPRWCRNKNEYLRMAAIKCPHCDAIQFPKRDVCPHCGGLSENMQKVLDKQKRISSTNDIYAESDTFTSADITNPSYYRKSENQYSRDIINYSDALKPEVAIEETFSIPPTSFERGIKIRPTEVIVYQSSNAEV
jgi:hypothetical protein